MGFADMKGWEIRVKLLVKLNTSLKISGKPEIFSKPKSSPRKPYNQVGLGEVKKLV